VNKPNPSWNLEFSVSPHIFASRFLVIELWQSNVLLDEWLGSAKINVASLLSDKDSFSAWFKFKFNSSSSWKSDLEIELSAKAYLDIPKLPAPEHREPPKKLLPIEPQNRFKQFIITINKAKDLAPFDINGLSDPYIVS